MRRFTCVAIDETKHWNPSFLADFGLKRIWSLYIYDEDEQTHLCELQPSYHLWPLAYEPDVYPQNKTAYERLDDALTETLVDAEPIYMHCSRVDRITDDLKETRTIEDEGENTIFTALESFQANAPALRGL